ncbi:MAG: TetR/AcrR family transcriptional regulator [Lachnospiraceae bacterium]|nr:TetR/AcrR family transcriptional regulator [Lachnospiraceae bacterium]
MPDSIKSGKKYDMILDALAELLMEKNIRSISVSEIAQKAGIGKGSLYYYFPSKDAILDALIERSYERPLQTAKNLAAQTDISPFTRMAMLFEACQDSSIAFVKEKNNSSDNTSAQDFAYLHHKYMAHVVTELKPDLTEIIKQGIESGQSRFDYPDALSEIVLIVLTVKLDNTLLPSTPEEIEETLQGLISLLERGTGVAPGTLNYLSLKPYLS